MKPVKDICDEITAMLQAAGSDDDECCRIIDEEYYAKGIVYVCLDDKADADILSRFLQMQGVPENDYFMEEDDFGDYCMNMRMTKTPEA